MQTNERGADEEPLTTKLPTGQVVGRLLQGAPPVNAA